MNHLPFILATFRLLLSHRPGKLALIFILTLLQGVNSGFSIVLLIPLLQLLNVGAESEVQGIALFFRNLAEKTGIILNIENILIIYVLLLTLGAFLQYWKSILDAGYQQTFIYQLRRRLFRKIISADWSSLNSRSKTNHLQVLTREVPNLANYYYFYLRLVTTLIMTISYLGYALLVSAKFTLLIAFTGIVLFFILRRFLFKALRLGEGFVDSYNRLLKYIDDFWQTVKIAKVHSSEDFYYNKFDEASTSLLDLEYRMQKNWSLPQLIYRIAGILVLVLVIYAGYKSGSVPITSFFILILLFSRIFPQFTGINTDVNMLMSNVASVKLVLKLDSEFPDGQFAKVSLKERLVPENEIRIENISFAYPDGEQLFRDFSCIIKAHSITGIIGESGRGKTTLIDIIAGLQKPAAGKILVDGRVLDDDVLHAWKQGIGYLPQDPFFIDGTLRENLVWDSRDRVSDSEIWSVLEQVNAVHLAKRYRKGLDAYIVNYQFSFSGGECQRLALARVLLRKPGLLLLDEATSSLDVENEAIIMDVISRLKNKMTILFVTHRTSLLPWFDKVINVS
ncbi:MAG: ABC transporter ATP-binding protein [Bacteroidales bacterium]|nr:ABC transporter ATP-binding protein [Bacteroidales bacterium]